jgi:hypothetical protein
MELNGEVRERGKIAILLGIDIDEFDINHIEYTSNSVANLNHYRYTHSRLKSCKCMNCFHRLRVDYICVCVNIEIKYCNASRSVLKFR